MKHNEKELAFAGHTGSLYVTDGGIMVKLSEGEKNLVKARLEIEHLGEWIREQGERSDICTYNILREVCSYCRCGKADKEI